MTNRNKGQTFAPADARKQVQAAPKRQLPPPRPPMVQRPDDLLAATERELSVTRLQRDDYLMEWQMAEQFIRQLEDHFKLEHSRPDRQPPTAEQAGQQAAEARDKPVQPAKNGKAPDNVVPLPERPAEKETADAAGPE